MHRSAVPASARRPARLLLSEDGKPTFARQECPTYVKPSVSGCGVYMHMPHVHLLCATLSCVSVSLWTPPSVSFHESFFRAALTSTHLRQLPAPCLCPEPGKLVKVGLRNAPSSLLCAVAAAVKQTGNRAWGLRESESKKEKVCVLLVQHCCRNRRHSQAISWFHQSCCRLRSMFH